MTSTCRTSFTTLTISETTENNERRTSNPCEVRRSLCHGRPGQAVSSSLSSSSFDGVGMAARTELNERACTCARADGETSPTVVFTSPQMARIDVDGACMTTDAACVPESSSPTAALPLQRRNASHSCSWPLHEN